MKALILPFFALLFPFFAQAQAWAQDLQINPVTQTCGTNCYQFSVSGLPTHDPGYKYFWFFDDGTFSQQAAPSHVFLDEGTHNVYVEVIRLYDKKDKPTADRSVTVNNTGTGTEPVTVSAPLTLLSNKEPRAGDTLVYVLTYGQKCDEEELPNSAYTLSVTFDQNQLEVIEVLGFNGENTAGVADNGGNITNLNFSGNLARRIFLVMKVDANLGENDTVNFSSNLVFMDNHNIAHSCTNGPVEFNQSVVTSHDPNYIIGSEISFCRGVVKGQYMDYAIHFQNIGAGPATEVEVRAYIPEFFDTSTLTTSYPSGITHTVLPNRQVIWKLASANQSLESDFSYDGSHQLLGTGQDGYGGAFPEAATRDRVEFSLAFNQDFDPCQAVFIQAEIFFDCNPPIRTNFFRTNIDCLLDGDTCVCNDSPYLEDTIAYQSSGTTLGVGGPGSFIWYPSAFLDSPFSAAPVSSAPGMMEYIAVVQMPNCSREVRRYWIDFPCSVELSAQTTLAGCPSGPITGNVVVTVQTNGQATDLVWNQPCNTTGSPWTLSADKRQLSASNLAPGRYVVAVFDSVTGCRDEIEIVVPNTCKKGTETTENNLLFWNKIDGMQPRSGASGPEIDLYPNPNGGRFQLQFKAPAGENHRLLVLDITGQEVFSAGIPKGEISFQVSLEKLGAGAYTIVVLDNNQVVWTKRMVKQ